MSNQTALLVQENRLIANVALIQALGGGWNASQLPSQQELQKTARGSRAEITVGLTRNGA